MRLVFSAEYLAAKSPGVGAPKVFILFEDPQSLGDRRISDFMHQIRNF